MLRSFFAPLTAAAVALSGCSSVSNISRLDLPKSHDPGRTPTVHTIVDRLNCELASLAADSYPNNPVLMAGNFVVAVQLSLTVNDDGSLAPSFSAMNGPFAFNGGAKLDVSREQNFTEKLFFSIPDMKRHMQDAQKAGRPNPYPCSTELDTPLSGDLGLRQTADMALNSEALNTGAALSGTDGAFGGIVTFALVKNLNAVGPTFTLTHFRGPGSLAGISENNTDKLTFAFAKGTKPDAKPADKSASAAKAENFLIQVVNNDISVQVTNLRIQTR